MSAVPRCGCGFPDEAQALDDLLLLSREALVFENRRCGGIEDEQSIVAIDEDVVADLNLLADALHPNDGGNLQRARHDRRVRGLAANLGDKTTHEIAVQLGRVGWREVVRNDNMGLIVGGWILRSLAEEMPDDTARHILDVNDALPEVGVIDSFKCLAVFVGDFLEDVFDAEMVALETAEDFVNESAILDYKEVGVENTSVVGADGGRNFLLDFEQFDTRGYEGCLKAGNLARHILGGNRFWKNLLLLGQMNECRKMRDALGNRYAVEPLFGFDFFNAPHLQGD